jgi:hypothetical protein
MNDPIKGNCKSCGKKYDIETYNSEDENHYDWGYVTNPCPDCFYNPRLEDMISCILSTKIRGEIKILDRGSVKVEYNSKEVTKEILDSILEYWPKPNKNDLQKHRRNM